MTTTAVQEKVRILDKEYTIVCEPDERDALRESARMLDAKMREIRGQGTIIGSDRIAVMAGLNIAHELLQNRQHGRSEDGAVNERLRRMQEKIETILRDDDPQLKL